MMIELTEKQTIEILRAKKRASDIRRLLSDLSAGLRSIGLEDTTVSSISLASKLLLEELRKSEGSIESIIGSEAEEGEYNLDLSGGVARLVPVEDESPAL